MPIEILVQELCDLKQGYTQYGGTSSSSLEVFDVCSIGLRPFGVSFLYAGWDKQHGFQLYASDPSGNYSGWKATAIGANSQAAQSIIKSDYKEEFTLKDSIQLAIKVLAKTMDSTTLTADKRASSFPCSCSSSGPHRFQSNSAPSLATHKARSCGACSLTRKCRNSSRTPSWKPSSQTTAKVSIVVQIDSISHFTSLCRLWLGGFLFACCWRAWRRSSVLW
jgi:hypothetical protein